MTEKLPLPPEIIQMYAELTPETQRRLLNDLRANIRRARLRLVAGGKKALQRGPKEAL
jgi:hypothetical protein